MKKIFNPLLLTTAVLLTSCKPSLNIHADYDRSAKFSQYKTFSMHELVTRGMVNQLNADRIVGAIKGEMYKRGFTEVEKGGDLLINAITVVKEKKTVSVSGSSYGYGSALRPYNFSSVRSSQAVARTNSYKDGTLVIDLVDSSTKKLVWTGTVNAQLTKAPKNPDEAIQYAVAKVMQSFLTETLN